MSSEKFVFNHQTLQYDKLRVTTKERILKGLGILSVIGISSLLIVFLAYSYLPSPKEKLLQNEIDNIKIHYSSVSDQIVQLDKVLNNIQERDANVHRILLGIEPIDDAVWNGGIGGHDKYQDLRTNKNAGELLAATQQKVDKIERQMYMQSKSLDELIESAKNNEDKLAAIPSIKPVREDKLKRNVKLLSGFGMRIHPVHKIRKMHAGIDFTAPQGTAIQATGAGKVVEVKNKKRGYGRYVIIDHGYGYKTLYGHMHAIDVEVGQKVTKGQQIGKVGSTGTSTAPHCHYEVRYQGRAINPIDYVLDGLTPSEYQELVRLSSIPNQMLDY